jgi:hypothetical protein
MSQLTCIVGVSTPNDSFGFESQKGGFGQVTITSTSAAGGQIDSRVNNVTEGMPPYPHYDLFVVSV